MKFWKFGRGGEETSPQVTYEKIFNDAMERLRVAPREGALTLRIVPLHQLLIHSGCRHARAICSDYDCLGKPWRQVANEEQTALAEVCVLNLLVHVSSNAKESAVRRTATVLDDLFGGFFPNAADFAASLYIQKRHDHEASRSGVEGAQSGVLMLAPLMALLGAASALGVVKSPIRPLPARFPVSDSESLEAAGVPLVYWEGQPAHVAGYGALLLTQAANINQTIERLMKYSPDEYAQVAQALHEELSFE